MTPSNGKKSLSEKSKKSSLNSGNRQSRRAKIKNKEVEMISWEYVKELYNNAIPDTPSVLAILKAVENEQLGMFMMTEEQELFKNNMNILIHDFKKYIEEIQTIYALHKDKKGEIDLEDGLLSLELCNRYMNAIDSLGHYIKNTESFCLDIVNVAGNRREKYIEILKERKKKQEENEKIQLDDSKSEQKEV
jgi:hypothetical protein